MRFSLLYVLVFFSISGSLHAQDSQLVDQYLSEIEAMAIQMAEYAENATNATTVSAVKENAEKVFEIVWGQSLVSEESLVRGAIPVHGWKTRWQVNNAMFDEAFAKRNGVSPPLIENAQLLGIMGRGRAVRRYAQQVVDSESASEKEKSSAEALISSLNNVIGWMKMDDGVTKGERQPRVDLTREWDSPVEFWLSTADTGWLAEVYSQAINILKVNYEGDVAEATSHAKGLVDLSNKVIHGVDVNKNGAVEPIKMEGGLDAVMKEARESGFLD